MRCGDVGGLGQARCADLSRATLAASSSLPPYLNSRSPMQMATSLGSSAPLTGNSQLPCSSFLPMQTGWLALPYSSSRTCTSISERFSSTTMMRSRPLREFGELRPSDRPDAADLEQAQAEIVALDLVDAELVERLAHVEIGLAGRDDADLRIAAAGGDDLVELVGAHEGEHGVALVIVQARFLAEEGVDQPDVEPARRHGEIGRA